MVSSSAGGRCVWWLAAVRPSFGGIVLPSWDHPSFVGSFFRRGTVILRGIGFLRGSGLGRRGSGHRGRSLVASGRGSGVWSAWAVLVRHLHPSSLAWSLEKSSHHYRASNHTLLGSRAENTLTRPTCLDVGEYLILLQHKTFVIYYVLD